MNTNEIIPIFFTIDDGYAPLLGVALKSMIENASPDYKYKVHIIHEDVSDENQKKICALASDNFDIEFDSMKDSLKDITDRAENHLRCDYFTLTIYFRLFIPEMFPQYDKGIYIDSDIIVPGDISKLYQIDLKDKYIGACPDHSVSDVPPLAKYMEQAIGIDRYHYINSGVLLMNLKKLREKKLSSRFLSLLNTYHFDTIAPDQDYLNAMCYGNIEYLDECWDVMPNKAGKAELENPMLIHYNLFDKPWCYDGIQYENYFWDYAKKTVFYDDVKKMKEGFTDKQKQSDEEAFKRMFSKADSIPDTDVTFLKMYESGVEIRL